MIIAILPWLFAQILIDNFQTSSDNINIENPTVHTCQGYVKSEQIICFVIIIV